MVIDDHDHGQRQGQPAVDVGELAALEVVGLEVPERHPDPDGREDLDQGESPVREQQLHAVEQQAEAAGDVAERGVDAPRLAERAHGLLDLLLVGVAHGDGQPPEGLPEGGPSGVEPCGGSGTRRGRGEDAGESVMVRGQIVGDHPDRVTTPDARVSYDRLNPRRSERCGPYRDGDVDATSAAADGRRCGVGGAGRCPWRPVRATPRRPRTPPRRRPRRPRTSRSRSPRPTARSRCRSTATCLRAGPTPSRCPTAPRRPARDRWPRAAPASSSASSPARCRPRTPTTSTRRRPRYTVDDSVVGRRRPGLRRLGEVQRQLHRAGSRCCPRAARRPSSS